jgi:uncharacterized protein with ATP-grasp and redox domains
MHEICNALTADPAAATPPYGAARIDCCRLVYLRDACLHDAGFPDPWREIKRDETEKALELLPQILEEVDAINEPEKRMRFVVEGVFAGNMFDLGTEELARRYEQARS